MASTDEMNANFGRFIYCNFLSNLYHISFIYSLHYSLYYSLFTDIFSL